MKQYFKNSKYDLCFSQNCDIWHIKGYWFDQETSLSDCIKNVLQEKLACHETHRINCLQPWRFMYLKYKHGDKHIATTRSRSVLRSKVNVCSLKKYCILQTTSVTKWRSFIRIYMEIGNQKWGPPTGISMTRSSWVLQEREPTQWARASTSKTLCFRCSWIGPELQQVRVDDNFTMKKTRSRWTINEEHHIGIIWSNTQCVPRTIMHINYKICLVYFLIYDNLKGLFQMLVQGFEVFYRNLGKVDIEKRNDDNELNKKFEELKNQLDKNNRTTENWYCVIFYANTNVKIWFWNIF